MSSKRSDKRHQKQKAKNLCDKYTKNKGSDMRYKEITSLTEMLERYCDQLEILEEAEVENEDEKESDQRKKKQQGQKNTSESSTEENEKGLDSEEESYSKNDRSSNENNKAEEEESSQEGSKKIAVSGMEVFKLDSEDNKSAKTAVSGIS
eukprot:8138540-Ditylum_brightwellii.AAC.1